MEGAEFVTAASDGSVYVVDSPEGSESAAEVVRIDPTGALDGGFGNGGIVSYSIPSALSLSVWDAAAAAADGLLMLVHADDGTSDGLEIVRVDADGDLLTAFGAGGVLQVQLPDCLDASPSVAFRGSLLSAEDGTIVLGSRVSCPGDSAGEYLAVGRFDANGVPIASFGTGGWLLMSNYERVVAIDSVGRVSVAGETALTRVLGNGSIDQSFSSVPMGDAAGFNPFTGGYVVLRTQSGVGADQFYVDFYTGSGTADVERPSVYLGDDLPTECPLSAEVFAFSGTGSVFVDPDQAAGDCIGELFEIDAEGTLLQQWDRYGDIGNTVELSTYPASGDAVVLVHQYEGVDDDRATVIRVTGSTDEVYPDVPPSHLWTSSPEGPRPSIGDPVNTASGALIESVNDLGPVAGVAALEWSRAYDSSRPGTSSLGWGWVTSWDAAVEPMTNEVVFKNEHGAEYTFVGDGAGGFVRPPVVLADLVAVTSGYELRWFDGRVWSFDSNGWLVAKADWAGVTVTADRDVNGNVASLTSSTGGAFIFTYVAAADGSPRLASISASDGRSVVYGYSDSAIGRPGLLSSVDSPLGSTSYTHDGAGRITSEIDGASVAVHTTTYGSDGRVEQQTLATGETTTFVYDDVLRTTTVEDATTSETVVYWYGTDARLVKVTDPDGQDISTTWNGDDQRTGSTNRLGHAPSATYDSRGNLLTYVDPVAGTTSYTYDANNRVTSTTEPTGAVTTFAYVGSERIPSTVTDALGGVTVFDVVDGLVLSTTDPDGLVTAYTYDGQRRMVSLTDGAGATWTFGYDAVGRRTSTTTPLGHTTSATYDDAGRLLTSTAADGGVTTFTYDAAGRVTSVVDPVGAVSTNSFNASTGLLESTTDPVGRVTTYAYDSLGQLISSTAPDGGVTETDFGVLGRITATRDPLGRETSYTYDVNGNVTQIEHSDGGIETIEYDTASRVTATVDPLGRRTERSYDAFGRLETITQPDTTTVTYGYDLLNRQVTTTAPDGGVTTIAYTAGGRVSAETNAVGETSTYAYDQAGRLSTSTDPLGHTTTIGYDNDGRRTSITTPEGRVSSTTYDPVGRAVSDVDPAGVATNYTYTLRGEVATQQHGVDGTISYTYNLDGTLDSVTDALGNTTSHGFDSAGRLSTRTDAAGQTETWTYNTAGEQVTAVDRLGRVTTTGYDPAGRVAAIIDPSGRSATFSYDLAGQQTSTVFGDGTSISYTYDQMGRRATMTGPGGVTTYSYDDNGRLVEYDTPVAVSHYTYDLAGRRTSLTLPWDGTDDGYTVSYDYDAAGRLDHIESVRTHLVGQCCTATVIDYTLDNDGLPLQTSINGTPRRQYTYDSAGRRSRLEQLGLTVDYSYDDSGRVASLTGAQNHTYTYDLAGQLTNAVQDNGTYAYTYGPRGEITSVDDPQGYRAYSHNAALEITEMTDGDTATFTYNYDAAGRLLQWSNLDGTEWTNTYDARGLLTATNNTETWNGDTYTYDGDGRLVNQDTFHNDHDNNFQWDPTLAVPEIVYGDGNWSEWYSVHGYEHEVTDHPSSSGAQIDYKDALGNTVFDHLGKPNNEFSPYGYTNIDWDDGYNNWFDYKLAGPGYNAEQHNLAGVHLRNRTLQPHLATFTTKDPLAGIAGTTTYTNPYHYANNDPINQHDPLGLRPSDQTFGPYAEVAKSFGVGAEFIYKVYQPLASGQMPSWIPGDVRNDLRDWTGAEKVAMNTAFNGWTEVHGDNLDTNHLFHNYRDDPTTYPEHHLGTEMYPGIPADYWVGFMGLSAAQWARHLAKVAASLDDVVPLAPRTAPGLADDFADHVVLGKSIGLEDQAAKIGGRHLMGSADWQADVLSAISNPNTRISVALDGLEGAGTAQSRVLAAVQRASSGRGSPLDWELMQLYQSGRLPTTSFYEGGSAITNPFG